MKKIRPFGFEDFPAIRNIYTLGISTGIATFETGVPEWPEWNLKYFESCRLVAEINGEVVGFAVLSPVSKRKVYRGVAEVSVYIHPDHWYQGLGFSLLNELIRQSEADGFWTLQASIFPQNKNSIKLHVKCGFREVGTREKIGKLKGRWFDNVLMERRSKTTGIT